jgi:hypothetical protein
MTAIDWSRFGEEVGEVMPTGVVSFISQHTGGRKKRNVECQATG